MTDTERQPGRPGTTESGPSDVPTRPGRGGHPRIIVHTGKGGVGKTSVAAATALLSAERGHRTIVVSTDPAHSLADAFDRPLGPEPVQIGPNLWAQESDIYHNVEAYWGTIQEYVARLFQWRGLDEVMAEELAVLPGMDEVANLLWIAEHHDSGRYDVVVVDAAPTGETLRLLALPEALRWWMEKVYPAARQVARWTSPVVSRVVGMPLPGDPVYATAEDLFRRVQHVRALLSDPDSASIRVVLNLEKMVIKEAQRSFTYVHLYGCPTDLVICNRVLPPDVGGYLAAWQTAQRGYRSLLEEAFAPVPVRDAPSFEQEVVGIEMLRRLGTAIFGTDDPTAVYHRGRPYVVRREGPDIVLSLELPFVVKDEVEILRFGDELVLQVGAWRRNLILPRILAQASASQASLDDHTLRIRFAAPPRDQPKARRTGT